MHVAVHGSTRAAAERLYMTQPAASMALAELERQLGSKVFARERGRLHLNARGRELLPLAQELLERYAEFGRHGSDDPATLSGELRIGASNTVGNYRVGGLLGAFVRNHPQVTVRLDVANTRDIVAGMLAHNLDVGCVEGPVAHPLLETRAWLTDALVICAAPDHPLARRRVLKPAHFAGVRWILREPGSATRDLSTQALLRLPPGETVLELHQTEAVKQATIAGLGIAFLPEVATVEAVAAGHLKVLSTRFLDLRRTLSVLLHRRRYRGTLLDAFLASLSRDGTGRRDRR